ncbi:MAG: HEAT repeat domain-containing protein [Desulfuromonadales bacterium]|nr:HEAT repeat domain-containing protein [Desulfuromonadales bacterium]
MNRYQLIQAALLSTDEEVRLNGLQSLYRYDGEERMDLVCAALGDSSWRIRKEAINLFLALPGAIVSAERIVALLYDEENAGLRNAAAEILIKLGPSVLPVLTRAAGTPDHDVRKFILDIMGDIGDRQATPLLLHLLQNDGEINVRAAAAENLGKIGDASAVPEMVSALSVPDLLVQFSLLDALGRIGCAIPVDGLVGLGENRLLRKPLFDALGRIGDETAVVPLVAGLHDPMRNVREAAILGLQRLLSRCGDKILAGQLDANALEGVVSLLASPSLPVKKAALAILGRYCDPARAVLLATYLDDDHLADDVAAILAARGHDVVAGLTVCWAGASDRKKAYLAYLFGKVGVTHAVNLLVEELKGADDFLRTILLRALGQVGRTEEIALLAGYLEVPEDDVRQAAVDGLVNIAERFHAPVIDLVRNAFAHAEPAVRQAALQVLGRLGGVASETVLLLAMKDESALVRRSAIYYLDGRNPPHLPALTLALTDEESDVRRQAVEALAMSAERSLLEPLSLMLQDEDPWVRATAIRALGRIGGVEALAVIRRGLLDPVGLVTIAVLETLMEESLPFDPREMLGHLDHADEDVVLALLKLLATASDPHWLEECGEALLAHPCCLIRQRVAELLGQSGTVRGQTLLQQRLQLEEEELVVDALRQGLASCAAAGERS